MAIENINNLGEKDRKVVCMKSMDSNKKQLLKQCNVEKLELGSEVSSNIYFMPNKALKPILVLKVGNILEENIFNKIHMAPDKFFQDDLIRPQVQVEIKNILELFFAAINIEQKKKLRNEFFSKLNRGEFRFIELAQVFKQIFSALPNTFFQNYFDTNEVLYNHANRVAVTASLLAITQDFYDKKFVADIYMLSWFLDYGLVEKELSFHIMKACEEERLAERGLAYLVQNKLKEKDINLFLNHPILSYKKSLEYAEAFTHSHLLEVITLHHENSKGTGFPNKKKFQFLTKLEQLIIITDKLVSYEKIEYTADGFVFKDLFRKIEKYYQGSNKVLFMAEKAFRESA